MADIHPTQIDQIPEVDREQIKQQFDDYAEAEYQAGWLPESLYRAFTGRTSDSGAGVGAEDNRRNEAQRPEQGRDPLTTPPDGGVSVSEPSTLQQAADGGNRVDRGQIQIVPDQRMRISLFENADRSTFLHESVHFFLEVMDSQSRSQSADPGLAADFDTLLSWFGIQGDDAAARRTAWSGMTLEQRRDSHEQFARGFESYLGEGKAPSPELQTAFARFRAWILSVYQALRNLNVELTDDVRGVFDRMLATDEEIEAAQIRQGYQPLVTDASEAGRIGMPSWHGPTLMIL